MVKKMLINACHPEECRVAVVADAVCSRRVSNLELGLAQARQAGATLTSTETVVFQLLGSSDHEAFREVSKLLR